ncbi:MAG: GNAT family N-acetyltransferase [Lachnospiraceae bacterium]|nr:GNAT family N-acetyltransferase [Lachnospiraceae bacterium]
MIFDEERFELDGKEILLRSAREDEADMLIDYLKTVSGETRFLMCEPDEIRFTTEEEIKFIREHNESEDKLLILAFVDGEYAGNCSFEGETGTRRKKHRAGIGIALFLKYTGFGLGRHMLDALLKKARERGFEQAELTVVGGNDRAYHLYESLGFKECGRISDANRYDDGTYSDDILMVKKFR